MMYLIVSVAESRVCSRHVRASKSLNGIQKEFSALRAATSVSTRVESSPERSDAFPSVATASTAGTKPAASFSIRAFVRTVKSGDR